MNYCRIFASTVLAGLALMAVPAPAQTTAIAPAAVTSPPVAPPPQPGNGPLLPTVIAWDGELKTIEATEGDEQGSTSFAFTNVSPGNVVILDVHPGCHCTSVRVPAMPWTIPPGSNAEFGVTVDLRGRQAGTFFKNVSVTTDKGMKYLNFRVVINPVQLPILSAADRAKNVQIATADRQAVFKGDCVFCHVKQGEAKYGKSLYDADCGICHDSPNRAAVVPDLRRLKSPTGVEFWRTWIAHGKPGTLMPAFAPADGGPLNDAQVRALANYLNNNFPPLAPDAH